MEMRRICQITTVHGAFYGQSPRDLIGGYSRSRRNDRKSQSLLFNTRRPRNVGHKHWQHTHVEVEHHLQSINICRYKIFLASPDRQRLFNCRILMQLIPIGSGLSSRGLQPAQPISLRLDPMDLACRGSLVSPLLILTAPQTFYNSLL